MTHTHHQFSGKGIPKTESQAFPQFPGNHEQIVAAVTGTETYKVLDKLGSGEQERDHGLKRNGMSQ